MTIRRIRLLSFALLCAMCMSLTSVAMAQSLTEQIDAILKAPALAHGLQGVCIKSLKTGQTLYERNADNNMIPASNFKLLASSTSLEQFGPDYTFKTEVYTTGKIENGVLNGNIILKGGGDPVLLTKDVTDLAKQIKTAGITQISGDIIADESRFDKQRLGWGWSWDDISDYYSAETSALSLNRNTVDVWVYPAKDAGAQAEVKLVPETTGYFTIDSTATTGKAGSQNTVWVSRKLGQNIVRISGNVPQGEKLTERNMPLTVDEPQLYTASVFEAELAKLGIKTTGAVKDGTTPKDAALVATHTSPPLSTILALFLKPSDNMIGEMLIKNLGAAVKGTGSYSAGAEVEEAFLKKVGLDMSALSIVDGSGLSRLDYISPRNLVTLLSYMQTSKYSKVFRDALPLAGVDGTLYRRMKGTAAERNVRAKTGTVSNVSTLSGYVNTKSGEPLAFSIMMNHQLCGSGEVTPIQNKICELLANLP